HHPRGSTLFPSTTLFRSTRNLVISSAVLALFVSVLSLFMARLIVRPMRRLADAAQRIAAGETGVTVDAGSSDELRRVSKAFNEIDRKSTRLNSSHVKISY